jgi:hypothetical protein
MTAQPQGSSFGTVPTTLERIGQFELRFWTATGIPAPAAVDHYTSWLDGAIDMLALMRRHPAYGAALLDELLATWPDRQQVGEGDFWARIDELPARFPMGGPDDHDQ